MISFVKFIKKPRGVISSIILILAIIGIIGYFTRDVKPNFDLIAAKRGDLIQEVSVTGRVKPAESVELAFEQGGKVSAVYVEVGKQVEAGQALVTLASAELSAELQRTSANVGSTQASLKQYEAALESERAKLEEMKKGSRPEEMQIVQSKVDSAQKSLTDAQTNLENVKARAEIDLANLYEDVPNVIQDGFVKADDAVHKQIDEIFYDDDTFSPKLTFLMGQSQDVSDAEQGRANATRILEDLNRLSHTSPSNQLACDAAIKSAKNDQATIRDFLTKLLGVVNASMGLSQSTINLYKTNINLARNNVNSAITGLATQEQLIAAQKVSNKNNIASAESRVNDLQGALIAAQNELALKRAGFTAEQLAGQAARVKQAQANVAMQRTMIRQAQAQVQSIQAQIAKAIIHAPISGLVTKQDAKVGEIVSGNVPIVSLISASEFEIEANVPEADIAKISLGDSAKATLDAYGSDINFNVKVVAIDPAETNIDGVATYKITLQFDAKDERIKSGMTANIDVLTEKREQVIVIPQRAVIAKNGDKIVNILDGETSKEIMVQVGLRGSDGNIEITEGINENDQVIIFFE